MSGVKLIGMINLSQPEQGFFFQKWMNKTTLESGLDLCSVSERIVNTNSVSNDGNAFSPWSRSIMSYCGAVDHPLDQYSGQRTSLNLQHATVLYKSMHLTKLIKLRKHGQSTQFANKQKDTCSRWWRQTPPDTCTNDFTSQWSMAHGSWGLGTMLWITDE